MASSSRSRTAAPSSPINRTSPPSTRPEFNNTSVDLQPGGFLPADPWFSPNPTFAWPYPSFQYDPRFWVWPTGIDPGPTFPNYTNISQCHPWMMNPGYAAIPNLQPDVLPPSNKPAEAPLPETIVNDIPTEHQPAVFHSDRRSDSQKASRPVRFKCLWDGCTYPGTFEVGTSLWRHIQGHIGPDWLKCPAPGCKKTFDLGRKDKYNAHIRRVHRDMADNLLDSPSLLAPA